MTIELKRFILLFLLVFYFPSYWAQYFSEEEKNQINEFLSLVQNKESSDSAKAVAYYQLGDLYYYASLDTMIYYSEFSAALCPQLIKHANTDEDKFYYKTLYANVLSNLGVAQRNLGDVNSAMDNYYLALTLCEELGDREGYAILLGNIGILNKSQGDIENAKDNFLDALEILVEDKDVHGIAFMMMNIGDVYTIQADYDKALDFYFQSQRELESIDDDWGLSLCFNKIAKVYLKQKKLDKALPLFKRSLQLQIAENDDQGVAVNLREIGEVYYLRNELDTAEKYVSESRSIAIEKGFPKQANEASKLLSDVYKAQGRGLESLEMYKEFVLLRDSISNEKTQREIARRQLSYEYEKQKALDQSKHEKELELEKKEKEKQTIISYAISFGLGIAIVFLFLIVNRLNVTRKQKLLIEKQKKRIEATHKEITDSIVYAKRIQGAILPPKYIVKEYLNDSFVFYRPKDVVAGDFYWMRKYEDKIMWAVADCTGHGVPGAMVSVVCNNALNRAVREDGLTDPGEVLDRTREVVIREFEKSEEDVKDGMDIALCVMEGKTLHYSGAYNPLWIIRKGECLVTMANRQPIGVFRRQQAFDSHQIQLEKGDLIYVFTDGFSDQFGGEKGEKFKRKRLKELILSLSDKSMSEQAKGLEQAFNDWKGKEEQVDDVCIIGVKIN